MAAPLLEVENLTTTYQTSEGELSAVDDISYTVFPSNSVGIVGESGSGKSVSVRSIVRLIESPGEIKSGSVRWKGRDILEMSTDELRAIRGNEIAMVFQEPRSALDPAYTVGYQIAEGIRAHEDVSKQAAHERAITLLEEVGIPNAEDAVDRYPHEYSGGMAQRALVAQALACEPDLLIADEPTTGLDVTIQAQVIDLFERLQRTRDMALLMITHDLGVVSEVCDDVIVMYAGRIAEKGSLEEIIADPKHPYTRTFLNSVPRIDNPGELDPIDGMPPNLANPPTGCRFHPRCPDAKPLCREERPPDIEFGPRRMSACYIHTEEYHR
ncbi:ABC transporter ATP-binding protein [Natrialbaceae archaeon A-CW3]